MRSRVINAFGASLCGVVLVIVVVTKFTKGAYLVLIAMPILYALMRAINRHYRRVYDELESTDQNITLPARNHVIVLVSRVHKPTLRALAFARATHPDTLTALTVDVDKETTRDLMKEWEKRDLPVKLKVLESPYREVTRPILNYIRELRESRPNDVVSVFIPEYVVGHWWEQLLHNQQALRLKGRLLFQPSVMVTSVPWQLDSSQAASDRRSGAAGRAGGARPRTRRPGGPRAWLAPNDRWAARTRRRATRPRRLLRRAKTHEGRVVFVRHALPGERVRARVTEDAGSYLRADAIEILAPSTGPRARAVPARRPGPVRRLRLAARVRRGAARAQGERGPRAVRPHRRPGRGRSVRGGRGAARRAARLAHPDHLRRRRGAAGRACTGTARTSSSRSSACPLGVPGVGDTDGADADAGPGCTGIEVVRDDEGAVALVEHRPRRRPAWPGPPPAGSGTRRRGAAAAAPSGGRARLRGRRDRVLAGAPGRADGARRRAAGRGPAASAGRPSLELYAGAGPLTALLADAVGPSGRVLGVEASRPAVADAAAQPRRRCPGRGGRRPRHAGHACASWMSRPDLVVLDPPRAGAGPDVMRALADLDPRAIGYVSCDPATLARDVRAAVDAGYELTGLRAFDAFPMTHHIECVALLERPSAGKTTRSPYAVNVVVKVAIS